MGNWFIKDIGNNNYNENVKTAYLNFVNFGVVNYSQLVGIKGLVNDKRLNDVLEMFDAKDFANVEIKKNIGTYDYFSLKYLGEDDSVKVWTIKSESDLGFPYVYWDWFEQVEENLLFEKDDLFFIMLLLSAKNNDIQKIITDFKDKNEKAALIKQVKTNREFIDSYILYSNVRYNDYKILSNNNYELLI